MNRYAYAPNKMQNRNNKFGFKNPQLNKLRINLQDDDDSDPMNSLINQNHIKQQLIKYIYDTLEISKYKYKLVEYDYDLPLLKESRYYISPNYNGITGLLVFIKLKEKYYSFIIDRRTLSYNPNQVDIEKVKLYPVKCRLDKSIYNGSILDGILLYNINNKSKIKNFIINDIYFFRGQDLTQDKIIYKLLNITTYLESYSKNDVHLNDINLIVNKLYETVEIKKLVHHYIPKSKFSNNIKGIAFYPEMSGTKLIYLYNNCSQTRDDNQNPQVVITSPVIKTIKNLNMDINSKSITAIFRIKKTETIDVYGLYLGKIIKENNKKFLKYKNFCLAYIPSKECSAFCKEIFSGSNIETAFVECKYIPEKDKWIPFKLLIDKKRPDDIEIVEEQLKKFKQIID
ncbi:Hypothetical protein KVN_LOCUS338 [uncultured virus]|nr:Hypothetical protein KVN_LOCUS338 [uncultured virus]